MPRLAPPLTDLARRQVHGVLGRWTPAVDPSGGATVADLVDPVLAAVTFEPTVSELAAELQSALQTLCGIQPSWAECCAAARDLLEGHLLLQVTAIDAA